MNSDLKNSNSHTISNGTYTVTLDKSGSGHSAVHGDLTLTRWRVDPINCQYGTYYFVQDLENNNLWSTTYQPTRIKPNNYEFAYSENKIEFTRSDFDISIKTEITIAEHENVELRKITISNKGKSKRKLALTSFAEVALFYARADSAHPAFAKMFVESEWEDNSLIFARRPRSAHEEKLFLLHTCNKNITSYESSRSEFIGRGNNISSANLKLSKKVGSVLDPIFSLQTVCEIRPDESESFVFITAFSKNKEELCTLGNKFKNNDLIEASFNRCKNSSSINTEKINFEEIKSKANLSQKTFSKNNYEFPNGYGGFVDNGNAYKIDKITPQPWSNIVANPEFGFIVTETGGGYTWAENSRENRLTPWQNDPVSDPLGEVIYIKENDNLWCPTPKPLNNQTTCKHGLGFSEFVNQDNNIETRLIISGSTTEKVKWWSLKLKNNSKKNRKLEIYLYLEWVLGVLREDCNPHLVSNFDSESSILYTMNSQNGEFANRIVYLGSSEQIQSYTSSRAEFIGLYHDVSCPSALESNIDLSKKTGSGFDSCGVLKVEINISANQEKEVLFFIGEELTLESAKKNALKFSSQEFKNSELAKVEAHWRSILSEVQVKTPDRSFDIMLNTWILYQTLSCRLYARSAYYQSGGAIGFRDQLQDVMALLYSRPEIARKQIILQCTRQFLEGDVQHWWHPPGGKGVRTRISDDYLWLPYVTFRYIEVTGDKSILEEAAQFLGGPKLNENQMEDYMLPFVSDKIASVYEHCTAALKHALNFGKNGFPLMGGGDWNDGMNEVGRNGKGESVWLAWFLSDCLNKFKEISKEHGDIENASLFEEKSNQLIESIDKNAWDGNWYLRAFFDDGTPMGSNQNDECRIDSLSQSWSVIVGRGNKERSIQAMNAIRKELVDKENKIICLLTPPFHDSKMEPGYIKGYLKGIRENGGQYTHAAAWVIMATAMEGKGKEALELFSMINPINHTLNETGCNKYKTEPYVYCGDVYSNSQLPGHGGWSWYTGSAAWLYQVGIEHIVGLKIRGDYFTINPCIDPSWKEFSVKLYNIDIEVKNPNAVQKGIKQIEVDGNIINEDKIKISKTRNVRITMG